MQKVKFFIGTSGWTYDHWKGTFYPLDIPRSRWFEYYCRDFRSVEVNATFYRTFGDSTYIKWRNQAPVEFRYVLKAPRIITHQKLLVNVGQNIREFCRTAALLENRLGMILLQLAPHTPYDPELLRKVLLFFDDPTMISVEFRNKKWMTNEVKALLEELNVVFCDVDSPGTSLMDWKTSETVYLRFHGRKHWYTYNYSEEELLEFAGKIKSLTAKGAKCVYVFFNNDFEGNAPVNASRLIQLLGPPAT